MLISWRVIFTLLLTLASVGSAARLHAQTFTLAQPNGTISARDFAAEVIGDPWDFEQAEDWNQTYSIDVNDANRSAWRGIPTLANGIFTGVSQSRIPTVNLQFEGIAGGFNMATRNGVRYPIDATRFRRLSMRVRRSVSQADLGGVNWFNGITRSTSTVGGRLFAMRGFDTVARRYVNQMPLGSQSSGWQIYKVDLDVTAGQFSWGIPWAATMRGLEVRMGDGAHMVDATVDLDWVRLSERGTAVADLSFSGFGGPVTVTARHQETGDVVQVYPDNGEATTFADNTTFRWDYGFLPPGTWVVTAARGSVFRTRELRVDPPPVIHVTEPDVSGGRDFATDVIGDPWDLANPQDVTRHGRLYDIGSPSYGPSGLTATTLGPGGELPNGGDAFVAFLDDAITFPHERVIPAGEYHRLTFTLEYLTGKALTGPVALSDAWGAVARIVWRARDFGRGGGYSETKPIVMLDGGPTTISLDLRTLTKTGPVEPSVEPTSPILWTGEIGTLRLDVNEASGVDRPFRLSGVRLAADDEAVNGSFTIRWRTFDATFTRAVASANGTDAQVTLFYDTDTNPGSGLVRIAEVPASQGSYAWNTAGVPQGTYHVYATIRDAAGNSQSRYSTGPVRVTSAQAPPPPPTADSDDDGMPDWWEARYGSLNAAGDADADGVSNLDEFRQGTDPLLSNRWILSEGATGFFSERLALVNPNPEPATLTVTYLREGFPPIARDHTVAGNSRATVSVNDVPGLGDAAVSAVVDVRSGGVAVERTMFWGAHAYGGHTGKALARARTQWYLAEGDAGFFDTYVLFANPNAQAADVSVTFLLEGGAAPVLRKYTVGPNARMTLDTRQVPGLAGRSFSTTVTSTRPITVERAMYFSTQGRFWNGGHASAALEAPSTSWFAAEGRTGPLFDTYLLLGNPNAQAAAATIRFLRPGGTVVTQSRTLPPQSRTTILVDAVPGLEDTDVSASVSSTLPIIVERAMYWPSHAWAEAHASAALTATGTRWLLAEGEQGGSLAFETYVLLANPGNTAASVRVTLLRSDGQPPVSQVISVAANSRATVNAGQMGLSGGERFGVLVDSTNGVPIVVERAMYWNGGGQFWGGGTGETGVRLR